MKASRYALLDRDGTLIAERCYLADPEGVELLPGAVEGLQRLRQMGLGLIVITNQSGIAKGYFSQEQLAAIHARMLELLRQQGVDLDGIYCCPHADDDGCNCRKPKTGLIEQAAQQHGFQPQDCFMVGDKAIDIQCGRNAGARTVLVRTGYGAEVERSADCWPDIVVDDLRGAAQYIHSVLSSDPTRPATTASQTGAA